MIDRLLAGFGGLIRPGAASAAGRRAYELAVEQYFGSGQAFAFWKGRVALYAILKALGIGPGDEVLVPGYTCVMVPGPVLYVGARPVYVDIEPRFFTTPVEAVAARITPRTRAVLVQHTYGYPAPACEIRALTQRHGIALIEDCCHTFGGRSNVRLLGTFGQAAFFSGQWNKPFSTGLGGLALVHDAGLAGKVRAVQAECDSPGHGAAFMLAAQLLVYELLIYPRTTALATRTFRWLTHKGLVVGSSSAAEFEPQMPAGYARGPAGVQCRLGRQEIGRVAANLAHRASVVRTYAAEVARLGYAQPVLAPESEPLPLLRFPLRVANKAEALAQAVHHGVEIGSWFECPLHPAETDQAEFGYQDGMCPVAETAAAEVINLPTHRRVGPRDVERTLAFVAAVCRPPPPA
ncbi:MAG: DegT/DnrJ/EryC1/StrS family aminotransferase [Planctomycetota bacterium]